MHINSQNRSTGLPNSSTDLPNRSTRLAASVSLLKCSATVFLCRSPIHESLLQCVPVPLQQRAIDCCAALPCAVACGRRQPAPAGRGRTAQGPGRGPGGLQHALRVLHIERAGPTSPRGPGPLGRGPAFGPGLARAGLSPGPGEITKNKRLNNIFVDT